jgi:hypothetical protein
MKESVVPEENEDMGALAGSLRILITRNPNAEAVEIGDPGRTGECLTNKQESSD